jgi:hypothetical protein
LANPLPAVIKDKSGRQFARKRKVIVNNSIVKSDAPVVFDVGRLSFCGFCAPSKNEYAKDGGEYLF